jgi:Rad3-related DNA helicase
MSTKGGEQSNMVFDPSKELKELDLNKLVLEINQGLNTFEKVEKIPNSSSIVWWPLFQMKKLNGELSVFQSKWPNETITSERVGRDLDLFYTRYHQIAKNKLKLIEKLIRIVLEDIIHEEEYDITNFIDMMEPEEYNYTSYRTIAQILLEIFSDKMDLSKEMKKINEIDQLYISRIDFLEAKFGFLMPDYEREIWPDNYWWWHMDRLIQKNHQD